MRTYTEKLKEMKRKRKSMFVQEIGTSNKIFKIESLKKNSWIKPYVL